MESSATAKSSGSYIFREDSAEKKVSLKDSAEGTGDHPIIDPSLSGRAIRISVLVLGILVVGSIIVSSVYGVHPISPMVHIHGNFSMTLPIVICGPTGVFSLGTLTVMLFFKKVRNSLTITQIFAGAGSRAPQYIAAKGLLPGMRPLPVSDLEDVRERTEMMLGYDTCETVKIHTRDGVILDAVWAPGKTPGVTTASEANEKAKELGTVIIFHGNACVLDDMADLAAWYHDRGINVLLVSIRGYGQSGKAKGKYREIGAYLDVEASLKYVVAEKGVDKNRVAVHGYSLGGALAAAAYYFFGAIPILMHTFTTYTEVSTGLVEGIVSGKKWISKSLIKKMMAGVAAGAFPSGHVEKTHLPEEDKQYFVKVKELKTDGFNNLKKIKGAKPFIFYGSDDDLMQNDEGNLGEDLFDAAYSKAEDKDQKRQDCLVMIDGDHVGLMNFLTDAAAQQKLEKYLREKNILPKKEAKE